MPPEHDDTDALLKDLDSQIDEIANTPSAAPEEEQDTDALLAEAEGAPSLPARTETPTPPPAAPLPRESDLPWYHPERGLLAGAVRGFMGNLGTKLAGEYAGSGASSAEGIPITRAGEDTAEGIPVTYAGTTPGESLEGNFQREQKLHPYLVKAGQIASTIPATIASGAGGARLGVTAAERLLGAGLGGLAPVAAETAAEASGDPAERLNATENYFLQHPGSTAAAIAAPAIGEAAAPILKAVGKPLIDYGNRALAKTGLSGRTLGRLLAEKGKQGLSDAGAAIREAGLTKPRKLSDYFTPADAERLGLNAQEVAARLGGPKGEITQLEQTMARTAHPDLRAGNGDLVPFGKTTIPRSTFTQPLRAAAADLEGSVASDAEKTIRAYEKQARRFERPPVPVDVESVATTPPPYTPKPKLLPPGPQPLAPEPGPWRAPQVAQAQVTGLGEAPPIVTPPGTPEIQPPLLPPEASPTPPGMPPPLLPPGPSPMGALPAETNALRPLPPGKGVITPPAPFRKPGAEPLQHPSPIIPPAPEQTALAPIEGDFSSNMIPGPNGPPIIPASTSIQKFDPGNVPSIWQRIKMRVPGSPAALPPPATKALPPGLGDLTPPAPEPTVPPELLGRGGKYPPESIMDAEFEPMGPPPPEPPPVFPRQRIKLRAEPEPPDLFPADATVEQPYTFDQMIKDKRQVGNQLFAKEAPYMQRRVGQREADRIAWETLADQTKKRIEEGVQAGVLNPQNVADYQKAMRTFGPAADVALDAGMQTGRQMKRPLNFMEPSSWLGPTADALPGTAYNIGKALQKAPTSIAKAAGALLPESGGGHRGITADDLKAQNEQKQQQNEDLKKSLFQRLLDKF